MLSSGDVGWTAAWGLTLVAVSVSGGLDVTSSAARSTPPPVTSPDLQSGSDPADPPFTVAIPDVTFEETPVGQQVSEVVTLDNTRGSSLEVFLVAVDGDGFELGDDGCGGTTLAAGESCDVEVIFEAQREGTFIGELAMEFGGDGFASAELKASVVAASATTPPGTTVTPDTTVAPDTTLPSATTTPPDTSTPATTLPVGEGDDVAALQECNERASSARVAYSPNLEMTVGVETEVEVLIGVGGVVPPTAVASTPAPSTTVLPAELACFIELELSGTGFEIETPVQSGDFTSADTGRWFWDVTPERSGQLDLELRITPKISTPDGFERGTPRPFTAVISVESAPRTVWQQIGDVSGGVVEHPVVQVALAAGAVGAAGSFVKGRLAAWQARRGAVDDEDDGYL